MELNFGILHFNIDEGGSVVLNGLGSFKGEGLNISEVQIAGEDKNTHRGIKMTLSSEGVKLRYISHNICGNILTISQQSDIIICNTIFEKYNGTNTIRVHNEIINKSKEDIVLEEVSSLYLPLLEEYSMENTNNLWIYTFKQSHHSECQPRVDSFSSLGLNTLQNQSQSKISFANIGSWSTKEQLPQIIVENKVSNKYLMFQIESNNSWYYEIAENKCQYYVYLSGQNISYGNWSKKLKPNEKYITIASALSIGDSVQSVIQEMSKYRRKISGKCNADNNLPIIFNEYMHLSWDSPFEGNTKNIAKVVSKLGVDYYVIDCGWHNEEPGNIIYPYVGQWVQSNSRFPKGIKEIAEYINSLNMKLGLWIEPEIIGKECQQMIDYYDDDCFIQRYGKKVCIMGRYFLDFRSEKVRNYLTASIKRMVEEYGAEYIKMDYNEDMGVGTDYNSLCMGEGLEECSKAYLSWIDEIKEMYPNVLFETCSSGGMRMDYLTLSKFSIVSTSDQINYLKYPYISSNILSAVLPEQAAVWSYPVTEEFEGKDISDERIILNMINSLLGRLHLASHIERLNDAQIMLIKEGIDVHRQITTAKKNGLPIFPLGLNDISKNVVCSGFKYNNEYYIAIWNMNYTGEVEMDSYGCKTVECVYPKNNKLEMKIKGVNFSIIFTEPNTARFIKLNK